MPFLDHVKKQLDHRFLRYALVPLVSQLAARHGKGVRRIFYEDGIWIHETCHGYFAYQQPFVRLNMVSFEKLAAVNFLWRYKPKSGDVIVDVGAGVGEEALTLSKAIGEKGKLICIEAHPRTFRCLVKLVQYNRLQNVLTLHGAVADPGCRWVRIEDSHHYLGNHVSAEVGITVPATTLDAVHQHLSLGRIQFLKMNIEGAEILAIRGMRETLRQTEMVCICCHDFLADRGGGQHLRTKSAVKQFLRENGFRVEERFQPGLPPYVNDQVWGHKEGLMKASC